MLDIKDTLITKFNALENFEALQLQWSYKLENLILQHGEGGYLILVELDSFEDVKEIPEDNLDLDIDATVISLSDKTRLKNSLCDMDYTDLLGEIENEETDVHVYLTAPNPKAGNECELVWSYMETVD